MILSVQSVITTVFFVSLLLSLLDIILKNHKVLKLIGPGCAIILIMAAIIRMFFPLELFYCQMIWVEDILSPTYHFLKDERQIWEISISVWDVLVMVWGVGILYKLIERFQLYHKLKKLLEMLPREDIHEVLDRYDLPEFILPDKNIVVVRADAKTSPFVFGFKKHYIVLPQIEFGKQQNKYILMHEMMHIRKRDTLLKMVIDVLCVFFWWNPIFTYVKCQMFNLIEMRNDADICKILSGKEQIAYMECLRDTVFMLTDTKLPCVVSFGKADMKILKNRMTMMLERKEIPGRNKLLAGLLMGIMLFLTSTVVIQPYSLKPLYEEEGDDVIPLTGENTFLVRNEEQYDVYYNGEYLFTTDDLRPFIDVKIYDNLSEVKDKE